MATNCDVLVIGAGAAGLSACRELSKAGVDLICIEARDRIGGRIFTLTDPLSPLPIELGPEFVHGRPPETWDLLRSGRLTVFDCAENAVHIVDGKVQQESDSWDQVAAITAEMKRVAASGADPTFLDFINAADFSGEGKALATSYVEGFNAARKEEISVASLALDATAAEAICGDRNFRVASGYQALLDVLLAGIDRTKCSLKLSTVVEHIYWARGRAEVLVRSAWANQVETIVAKQVVLTLPLGVLQAPVGEIGAVEFSPSPGKLYESAGKLRFGQVMRVVMRFAHPWWEDNPDLADAGFWLSQERYFPTWWTTLPVRSPLLTGWSAGPHSDDLIGRSEAQIVERALGDLAKVSNKPVQQLIPMLEAVHFHDWHADPFARGAYSYVPAGAMKAREELATPIEDTLFFAGEATETNGHGATVHGAIASGRRAAQQVLQSSRLRAGDGKS